MDQPPNPYESPLWPSRPLPNWREWLRSWFRPPIDPERFLHGARAFHYGVVFHVDPNDDTQLIASLPLAVDDEIHIRRNLVEARRVLAEFLTIHSGLAPVLMERTLVVSMISSYTRIDDVIRRISVPATEWNRDRASALASAVDDAEDIVPDGADA